MQINKNDALCVVDVQYDFCEGGALAVKNGEHVVPVINKIRSLFSHVIFTQDYHPKDHVSFVAQGGKWSEHCVIGTKGANLCEALLVQQGDLIFRKGMDLLYDSYSAFYDEVGNASGLSFLLKKIGIERLFFAGLARDICVYESALGAKKEGFDSYIIWDASAALDQTKEGEALFKDKCSRSPYCISLCCSGDLI